MFFDAHTHIHFPAYDADREAVFRRAKEAGVKMITVGTQLTSSRAAVEFATVHNAVHATVHSTVHKGDVWATVGFHPAHFSEKWYHDKNEQSGVERERFDVDELRRLAKEPGVVAIGECGLDYFRDKTQETRDGQKDGFLAQIELAHEVRKPLMIHCRAAFPDLIDLLKANGSKLKAGAPGAIHFFSGTEEEARELLKLGFVFTFGGVITFTNDYDNVIEMLPLEAILSETDAPYVAPVPYRGKRNEPAYVAEVVRRIAELKQVSAAEAAERIFGNAKRIFGLS